MSQTQFVVSYLVFMGQMTEEGWYDRQLSQECTYLAWVEDRCSCMSRKRQLISLSEFYLTSDIALHTDVLINSPTQTNGLGLHEKVLVSIPPHDLLSMSSRCSLHACVMQARCSTCLASS